MLVKARLKGHEFDLLTSQSCSVRVIPPLRRWAYSTASYWVSEFDRVSGLAQRTYLILFWVGFLALFRGFSQVMLAFSMRPDHARSRPRNVGTTRRRNIPAPAA